MRFLILKLSNKLDEVIVLGNADDETASSAIDHSYVGKHLLNSCYHFTPVLFILKVDGQSMALSVLLLQVERCAHAFHSPLNNHANSICQYISLLH
jgi:hypothetical protein